MFRTYWGHHQAFTSVFVYYYFSVCLLDTNLYIVNICKHCLGSQECMQLFNKMVHSKTLINIRQFNYFLLHKATCFDLLSGHLQAF